MQLSSLDKAQKEEDHEQQQEKRSREEGQKRRATNHSRCPAARQMYASASARSIIAARASLTAALACTASIGYSNGGGVIG